MTGVYLARGERMAVYLEKSKKLMEIFPTISVEVIPRAKNVHADAMAKLASMKVVELLNIMSIEFLVEPNIREQPEVMELVQEPSQMDPIVVYLNNKELPEATTEDCILQLNASCS